MGQARVSLVADASGVRRGVRDAEGALDRLNKSGTRHLGGLKTAGLAAGAAMGALAIGAIKMGKDSAQAAIEAEASMAKTKRMVEAAGVSWAKYGKQIDATIQKHSALSGFDDEQLAESFANLTRVTKDHNAALEANAVVMDLARGKGMSLENASTLVGKVLGGNTGVLKRYGITLKEGATAQEALAAIQKQFAGQAEAYGRTTAGSVDRAKVSWENLQESLGAKIAPAIATAMGALTQILNRQGPVWDKVHNAAKRVAEFYQENLAPAFENIYRVVKRVFERMWPAIKAAMDLIVNSLAAIVAVLRGDWSEAWERIKDVPGKMLRLAWEQLKGLAGLFLDAGRVLGGALKRGLMAMLGGIGEALLGVLKGAVNKLMQGFGAVVNWIGRQLNKIPSEIVPQNVEDAIHALKDWKVPQFARGGVVPGRGRGDTVPALLTPGEVILNQKQQRMVGVPLLAQILASTGAVVGGGRFAAGGVVNPVPGGSWRGGPYQGTHTLGNWQSDNAYDIFGPDGAKVVAAGSGVVGRVSPFSSDPRFWGHGLYLSAAGTNLFYKHLKSVSVAPGQRVTAGQVLGAIGTGVNGGPHLHFAAQAGNPSRFKVAGSPGTGAPDGPDSGELGGAGVALASATSKFVKQALSGIGGARDVPSGMSGGASTAATAAGVAAGNEVRRAGGSPDAQREAAEDAERTASIKWWKAQLPKAVARRGFITNEIKQGTARLQKLAKQVGKVKGAKAAVAKLRARLAELKTEKKGIRAWIVEIKNALFQLGLEEQQDALEGAPEEGSEGGEGASGEPGAPGGTEAPAATPQPSASEVALALAQLTPGLDDDIAATSGIVGEAEQELAAALASGDGNRIIAAANRLAGLRSSLASLQQQNTPPAAIGPSNEITMNIYPSGAAANDPRALASFLGWNIRTAVA